MLEVVAGKPAWQVSQAGLLRGGGVITWVSAAAAREPTKSRSMMWDQNGRIRLG